MSGSREVRVSRKWKAAEGIFGFELVSAANDHLPNFSAGSHIDVHIPGGFVRQYSLLRRDSGTGAYEIGVLDEPESRGGSRALCNEVMEGDTLSISEPRNHFPLEPGDHSILIAGGIGITPILCMAERLSHSDSSFELHYCCRTPSRMAFRDEIAVSAFAHRASLHFDDGDAVQLFDVDRTLGRPSSSTHLYICGPAGFLDFVKSRAKELGWDNARVHFEYFAAPQDTRVSGAGSANASFEVVIASTGESIFVPAEKSVAQALIDAGIDIAVSCESGVCGTCLTRVVEGELDHQDFFLSDDERARNDQFLPCCSRALSPRIVIDI